MKKYHFTRLVISLLFFVSFLSEASYPISMIGWDSEQYTNTRTSSGDYSNDFWEMYYRSMEEDGITYPAERLNSVFIPIYEDGFNTNYYMTPRDLMLSFTLTTTVDPSIASLGDLFYESFVINGSGSAPQTIFTETSSVNGIYTLTGNIFLPESFYEIYAKIPTGLGYTTTLTTSFTPAGPIDPMYAPSVDPVVVPQVSSVPELSETLMMFIGTLCLGGLALKRKFNPKYWKQDQNCYA